MTIQIRKYLPVLIGWTVGTIIGICTGNLILATATAIAVYVALD